MIFSMFRSHRNRIYWRNGKLHFIEHNPQQQNQLQLTSAQREQEYRYNIRQWFIFYGIFVSIIVAILVHRLYSQRKYPVR